jgi:hypothetical protein
MRLIDTRVSEPAEAAIAELTLAFASEEARREVEMVNAERAKREHEWIRLYRKAEDKAAVVRELLASGTKPNDVGEWRALLIGAAIERGLAGEGPDLAASLPWYARAIRREALAGGEAAIDAGACNLISEHLARLAEDHERAAAWLERGIARGSADCLYQWLASCLEGTPGFAGRRDEAPHLIAALRAAGSELRIDDFPLDSHIAKEAQAAIDRGDDPQAWKPWLEIMAGLGSARARTLLEARAESAADQ